MHGYIMKLTNQLRRQVGVIGDVCINFLIGGCRYLQKSNIRKHQKILTTVGRQESSRHKNYIIKHKQESLLIGWSTVVSILKGVMAYSIKYLTMSMLHGPTAI